jgi:hypothetical protein
MLRQLDYQEVSTYGWQKRGEHFRFDLFSGNHIHTTELFESPLKEQNHKLLKKYSRLYIGILNEYDLISAKLFRGSGVDFEDCVMLIKSNPSIDIGRLKSHYLELVTYQIGEDRIRVHIDQLIELLGEEK